MKYYTFQSESQLILDVAYSKMNKNVHILINEIYTRMQFLINLIIQWFV